MWNNLIIAKMQETYFQNVPPMSTSSRLLRKRTGKQSSVDSMEAGSSQESDHGAKLTEALKQNSVEPLRKIVKDMSRNFATYSSTFNFPTHVKGTEFCFQFPNCWLCQLHLKFKTELEILCDSMQELTRYENQVSPVVKK
eukprot:TRINITY_DN7502_c0_g1_i2.p1 TRINITY_DN7502_c0_g1~~TRINITY_DN7502_c0_g1_i2.p1  ORF type:complete len:140 (-),score=30.76 TRINITY_DN7502_c0_g1_i2:62-481(-)